MRWKYQVFVHADRVLCVRDDGRQACNESYDTHHKRPGQSDPDDGQPGSGENRGGQQENGVTKNVLRIHGGRASEDKGDENSNRDAALNADRWMALHQQLIDSRVIQGGSIRPMDTA